MYMCVKNEKHKKLKSREKKYPKRQFCSPSLNADIYTHTHTHTQIDVEPFFCIPLLNG